MRILIANDSRIDGGGVGTYLWSLMALLGGHGHSVALLHDGADDAASANRLPAADVWSVENLGLDEALSHVRAWGPDVCYSHNMRRLEIDERLSGEWPTVKMMHGYFGTCVSGQKSFSFPDARACSRHCGPACLVHYLPRRCGYRNPAVMMSQYTWAARQRALFSRYAAIVVASDHMRREYLAHGTRLDRTHTIPLFASVAPPSTQIRDPIDVVFLGRLTTLKGGEELVRATRVASDRIGQPVMLTIAGEGPERAGLERLSGSLGVRASFTGWVDDREKADLLSRAALLAIPSLWPEPFGLVGLEAAAFAVPAVGFDVGGISSWLTDGVNGRLVPRGAGAAGFGDAMASILGDAALRARLSCGARTVATRFTPDAHLASLERIFDAARRA
jgi:glycosyltransferase involved in cell wall biosynthesis